MELFTIVPSGDFNSEGEPQRKTQNSELVELNFELLHLLNHFALLQNFAHGLQVLSEQKDVHVILLHLALVLEQRNRG